MNRKDELIMNRKDELIMNPRQAKYVERMKNVIELSNKVLDSVKNNEVGEWIEDQVLLHEWLIKSKNILLIAMKDTGIHYLEFEKLTQRSVVDSEDVNRIKGVLIGALDDYENGYTLGQEFLIAGEIFDSVLEEGKLLLKTDHTDAAAVLGRVIIEDSLKRIARREEIDDKFKISRINEELKKASVYSQPQWRLIQAWLDIGNSAAHGNFSEYTKEDVINMYYGVEQFIASYF